MITQLTGWLNYPYKKWDGSKRHYVKVEDRSTHAHACTRLEYREIIDTYFEIVFEEMLKSKKVKIGRKVLMVYLVKSYFANNKFPVPDAVHLTNYVVHTRGVMGTIKGRSFFKFRLSDSTRRRLRTYLEEDPSRVYYYNDS